MAVWHIAVKKIKTMLLNPVMMLILVGLPLFQMFIMKTILGSFNVDNSGQKAEGFVEVTLVGLKISLTSLNAASTLVQFLLVTGVIGASLFIQEREKNILVRIFSVPVRKSHIVLGNLIGQVLVTALVAAVIITLSRIALGIDWGESWLGVFVVTLFVLYVSTALGFIFSGLFRSFKVANGVMIFLIMFMTFLSGGFSLDEQFDATSRFTINKWAFDAYAKLMDGQPIWNVVTNLAVLAVIGTVLLIAACIVNRRENIYE
ncbi:MAG: ABC transporter permease [Clostridia bacterium]|nr:ABC transporter permease [Clostridia bacterium]